MWTDDPGPVGTRSAYWDEIQARIDLHRSESAAVEAR